jgi:hypothetical protein
MVARVKKKVFLFDGALNEQAWLAVNRAEIKAKID